LADSDPSYSLVAPYVYIGDKRTAKDKDLLQSLGITSVVNVTKDIRNYFDMPPFKYLKCPCDDTDVSNLTDHFDKAADFIAEAVSEGHSVLVHCHQGVSRSVSIVLAYLIKKQQMTLKEAYSKVRSARPEAKPKQNFLSQLVKFEQRITVMATNTKKRKSMEETKNSNGKTNNKITKTNENKGNIGPTMPTITSRISPSTLPTLLDQLYLHQFLSVQFYPHQDLLAQLFHPLCLLLLFLLPRLLLLVQYLIQQRRQFPTLLLLLRLRHRLLQNCQASLR